MMNCKLTVLGDWATENWSAHLEMIITLPYLERAQGFFTNRTEIHVISACKNLRAQSSCKDLAIYMIDKSWEVPLCNLNMQAPVLAPKSIHTTDGKTMDRLGIAPRTYCMLSGCDTTTPTAPNSFNGFLFPSVYTIPDVNPLQTNCSFP